MSRRAKKVPPSTLQKAALSSSCAQQLRIDLVADVHRGRVEEVSRATRGVVGVRHLSASTTLNGGWRCADAGRVVARARPDVMAATATGQKADGCQNEEQAIHVVFPRAETGTALGRSGHRRGNGSQLGAYHFEPTQCRKAGPVGLIGVKTVKIEQFVSIPPC